MSGTGLMLTDLDSRKAIVLGQYVVFGRIINTFIDKKCTTERCHPRLRFGFNSSSVMMDSEGHSEMSVPYTKLHGVGSQQTLMPILTTTITSDVTMF